MGKETEVLDANDAIPVRFEGVLSKIELGPEDVLVLELPQGRVISKTAAENVKRLIANILPGRKVLVLDDGARLGVLKPTKKGE